MIADVVGTPQHYDWGDGVSIPTLLGLPSEGKTWAEMWFGTHPVAPARLALEGSPPLTSVVGTMSMLVKLLACARPLSLQTHPTAEQAEVGFRLENAAGIALDAPDRVYRDSSDKPETLIALSHFEALCGFRPVDDSLVLLRQMAWYDEARELEMRGIAGYMAWAFDQAQPPNMTNAPDWLHDIARQYPTDRALRIAPLLHHITLRPGEAISLAAGNLHAYLNGFGLEVMSSSDNVVRAGFTSKHIDVAELLRVVNAAPSGDPRVPTASTGQWTLYPSASPTYSIMSVRPTNGITLLPVRNHRLVFGPFHLDGAASRPRMIVQPAGDELVIPATDGVVWVITQN